MICYNTHTMKTRVTLTLEPQIVRKAKNLAHRRHTSVSGLVEDLLLSANLTEGNGPSAFVEKWAGSLKLSQSLSHEPRFQALKAKYDL